MQKVTLTCDNGDELLHRTKSRTSGDIYYSCNFCDRNGEVKKGFYACKNADDNCIFDCCPTCYNGKMRKEGNKIEESKGTKPENFDVQP